MYEWTATGSIKIVGATALTPQKLLTNSTSINITPLTMTSKGAGSITVKSYNSLCNKYSQTSDNKRAVWVGAPVPLSLSHYTAPYPSGALYIPAGHSVNVYAYSDGATDVKWTLGAFAPQACNNNNLWACNNGAVSLVPNGAPLGAFTEVRADLYNTNNATNYIYIQASNPCNVSNPYVNSLYVRTGQRFYFRTFPVPANEQLHISFATDQTDPNSNTPKEGYTISIADPKGIVVFSQKKIFENLFTINTAEFTDGAYTLSVSDGENNDTQEIIIAH
jgi:hypothetical protein